MLVFTTDDIYRYKGFPKHYTFHNNVRNPNTLEKSQKTKK